MKVRRKMKFSQMPYERPNLEEVKKDLAALVEKLKNAVSLAVHISK